MTEPIVSHGGHGLPFSKGLTAQSLSASGLSPPRAFELAREVERRLLADGTSEIDLAGLRELTGEVLLAAEGEGALRRWRSWSGLDRLDPPARLAGFQPTRDHPPGRGWGMDSPPQRRLPRGPGRADP